MFKSLFINRNLGFLFIGQVVSQIGDSMYQIGLMWLVLEMTGSKSATGTVAMISYLPMLIFGLAGGVVVDLFDRRKVMMFSDFFRALVVLGIPIAFYFDQLTLPVIMLISFLVATLATAFNPARDSLVPSLVERKDLLKANALIQISNNSAIILGPAIGATLLGIIGVVNLFSIDAVTFLISLVAIFLIRPQLKKIGAKTEKRERPKLWGQFTELFHYIHQRPRLQFLLGLTAVNNFFIMGPAIVGVPIFVKETLKGDATSYALAESALGVGMILGSFLVAYLGRRWGKGKILLLGMIFDGLTHIVVYFIGSLPLFMLAIAFHAIGISPIVSSRTALVQEWTDEEKLGRVFSLLNVCVVGVTAIAAAATGWLAEIISVNAIFGIFGSMATLCGIVGWFMSDLKEQ